MDFGDAIIEVDDVSKAVAVDQVGSWCSQMPGASRDNTFGPETDVYRVSDKIFAMVNTDDPGFVTLKAPPEEVQAVLAQYDCARPGYYMNKRHWVTIDLNIEEPVAELRELIADSYRLVFSSLSKKHQAEISSS